MTVSYLTGDCRAILPTLDADSVQCCVTSPPYFGLRDYGVAGQIGLESSVDAYVAELVAVFREVRRVLRDDGTLWLNLGDSYAGSWGNYSGHNRGKGGQRAITNGSQAHQKSYDGLETWRPATSLPQDGIKPKDLIGIPWRVAFALQADGWWLRADVIWAKPAPMPESVRDRPTRSHEHLFLLAKGVRYFYDADAIAEDAVRGYAGSSFTFGKTAVHQLGRAGMDARSETAKRNKRDVWTIPTARFAGAHFATFPPALIEPCIKAGSRPGDTVLDPFGGAGTTGLVAERLGRDAILIDLNPDYMNLARERIAADAAPILARAAD